MQHVLAFPVLAVSSLALPPTLSPRSPLVRLPPPLFSALSSPLSSCSCSHPHSLSSALRPLCPCARPPPLSSASLFLILPIPLVLRRQSPGRLAVGGRHQALAAQH